MFPDKKKRLSSKGQLARKILFYSYLCRQPKVTVWIVKCMIGFDAIQIKRKRICRADRITENTV